MCRASQPACLPGAGAPPARRGGAWRWALGLWAVAAAALGGCRGVQVRDGRLLIPERRIQLATLPAPWQRVKLKENDVAYQLPASGHAVAFNGACEDVEDAPLEVLTRHLLMGFTDQQQLSQERLPLDGREALRSHYRARLDGVPVELLLVVLKKDRCLYDFSYVSPPGRFAEREGDFERLVASFHAEPLS